MTHAHIHMGENVFCIKKIEYYLHLLMLKVTAVFKKIPYFLEFSCGTNTATLLCFA